MATSYQVQLTQILEDGSELLIHPVNTGSDNIIGIIEDSLMLELPGESEDETLDTSMSKIKKYLRNLHNVAITKRSVSSSLENDSSNDLATSKAIFDLKALIDKNSEEIDKRAITNHASNLLTYGGGTTSKYGHVKLSDIYETEVTNGSAAYSIGASQKALYLAYHGLNETLTKVVKDIDGKLVPENHASEDTKYGIGNSLRYGHVKLKDDYDVDFTGTGKAEHGVGASAYGLYSAYKYLKDYISTNLQKHVDSRASATEYSHVKLTDDYSVTTGAESSVAPSSKAIYLLYQDLTKNGNAIDNTKVKKSGDTLTGGLTFQANNGSALNNLGVMFSNGNSIGSDNAGGVGIYAKNGIYLRPGNGETTNTSEGVMLYKNRLYPSKDNYVSLGSSSNKWSNVYATKFIGNLTGNASTATKLATARKIGNASFDGSADITLSAIGALPQIIGYYGSDNANTAGWYKVCTVSQSGYSDYSLNLLITQGYGRLATGILHVHTRCENGTTIILRSLKWMYRYGFAAGDVIVTTGNNTWSLYVYQPITQYGRIQVEVISKSGTSGDITFTLLSNNATKETSTPSGTAATDGGIVQLANTATTATKLATARTIALTGSVTGSGSFDGSGNLSIATTTNHAHASLKGWADTRKVATKPNDYNDKLSVVGIKEPSMVNSNTTDFGNYVTIMGIRGWGDSSGGDAHEIGFAGNGTLWHRHGGTTSFGSWGKIYTSQDKPTLSELGAAALNHTHNYAGSSSAGGSATSAVKLDSSAGSATQPIYFSDGKPLACTYTLGKSVPSNAVFTDTKVTQTAVAASGYTNWRPLILGMANSSTEGFAPTTLTDTVYTTNAFEVQPSTGTLKATTFKGNLTGNASTATKTYGTLTNPSSGTIYHIPFHSNASSENKSLLNNNGLQYYTLEGTTSAVGNAELGLGNSAASGTAGNKRGKIYMYGTSSGYTYIVPGYNGTGSVTITLPSSSGTLSLNGHTHTKSQITDFNKSLTSEDLNNIKTVGFYYAAGDNTVTNKPSGVDAFGLEVLQSAGGWYTQILYASNNVQKSYRRWYNGSSWTSWTEDRLTDTNTWRGIQNNLTSTSTTDSLSANQGRLLANGSARDSTKLPLAGGTMKGALNFANGTWNVVGDDVKIGDINVGGVLGIIGNNANTAIHLVNYGASTTTGNSVTGVRWTCTGDGASTISGTLSGTFKGNLTGKATSADSAYRAGMVEGQYTGNGGQLKPNYFGRNRVGFRMMNSTINGNSHYKDFLIMDCYSGDDVGGATAIGVDRQEMRAFIMGSDAVRTSWTRSAELITTSNIGSQSVNYATSAGNANSLSYFQNTSSTNMGQDTCNSNAIGYVTDYSGSALTSNIKDGALYRQVYSTSWAHEIYGDYRSGQIAVRGKNNGTWQSWRRILDESNYKSFCTPANIGAAASNHAHSYLPLSGGTLTGLLTAKVSSPHSGIKLGDTYVTAIGGDVIFQNNNAIRFGGDSWEYNVWAGLKYVPSSKAIYLGLADGSAFTANSAQSGGTIYTPGISALYVGNTKVSLEGHAHNYAGSSSAGGAATNADKLDGYHGSSSQAANTYVLRDANGYTYHNYINSNTSNSENPTVSQFIVTNGTDNFYRKASLAHVKSALGSMTPSSHASSATTYGVGDTSNYGHVKISTSSSVTSDSGLVLSASEKNPNVSGSLANKIANISGGSAAEWKKLGYAPCTTTSNGVISDTRIDSYNEIMLVAKSSNDHIASLVLPTSFASGVPSGSYNRYFLECNGSSVSLWINYMYARVQGSYTSSSNNIAVTLYAR